MKLSRGGCPGLWRRSPWELLRGVAVFPAPHRPLPKPPPLKGTTLVYVILVCWLNKTAFLLCSHTSLSLQSHLVPRIRPPRLYSFATGRRNTVRWSISLPAVAWLLKASLVPDTTDFHVIPESGDSDVGFSEVGIPASPPLGLRGLVNIRNCVIHSCRAGNFHKHNSFSSQEDSLGLT